VVAVRKPPGAAKALLAYLPFSDDPAVAEQVGKALVAVAFSGGKADPDLLRALEDAVPVRRAFAGEALCSREHPEQFPAVRKLLHDAKPAVRLRAALALAKEQDVEAIPVLIDLLAELAPAQRRPCEELLQELAGEWAPILALAGDDDVSRQIRRDAWAAWWKRTDGPLLLEEFRKRTLSAADLEKIQTLIRKLGAESFRVREQATADLVAYGGVVVPLLREAAKDADLERKTRAATCLKAIARSETRSLPPSAARLLALRKPAGAVEVLLAFLPWAEDDSLADAVQTALASLAVRDGKTDPALVRALDDALPLRRAAAGLALAKAGGAEHREAVRKLLRDADPMVRLRVALALVAARDKEAVPVLIDTLADLSREQSEPAQEALFLLAGDKAPEVMPGDDEASRKKYRAAWAAWWQANSATVDLAKLNSTGGLLGYTLVVEVDQNGQTGHVLELGRDGKPRWKIEGLIYPIDARMISDNRVLIVEFQGRRVTERDLKGNIIWQSPFLQFNPVNAQRLRNGNTFIVTQIDMFEVDRSGKEVYRRNLQGQSPVAAYKTPQGEIIYLTNQGMCVRLDARGKEIRSFVARAGGGVGAIDVSPTGQILIVQNPNMVHAFDRDGKTLFQVNAPNVTTASWLPNGNILVASYNNQRVVELDRTGRVIWEYRATKHVFRARRR
jgi:HEAT repeat protein